jgi:hypothetical protein
MSHIYFTVICPLVPGKDCPLIVRKVHPRREEPDLPLMTFKMASLVPRMSLICKLIDHRTDLEYVVPVTVGTPPQTVHLDFDTVRMYSSLTALWF